MKFIKWISVFAMVSTISCSCSKKSGTTTVNPPPPPPPPINNEVDFWLTRANQTALLQKQSTTLAFGNTNNGLTTIDVDSSVTYQTIDGFGYTLTGGSAYVINKMDAASKNNLLNELFGNGQEGIGISYLRVSMGASDLDATVFSYNDLPTGQTDINLTNFNLSNDTADLIPVLKKIIAINPNIKILASPWSAPLWMKDNANSVGGSLQPQYYNVYSKYFVKYIQAMKAQGITIDAVTIQNEPLHGGNNPSMVMSATQQADFVKNYLGPAFQTASVTTKIIVWDHNCDNPNYPITVLNDAGAKQYIDGSAFHLYGGDISALSTVRGAHPDKNLYFTEQWTSSAGDFGGDLKWHIKNVIIGSMRNWSKNALEWNLANDPSFAPHTPGGCTQCKGAVTISGNVANKNVAYYIIAQASKFVPMGSKRIFSTTPTNLMNVAFLTPQGKKVMLVLNEGGSTELFNIKYKDKTVLITLDANSVATLIW